MSTGTEKQEEGGLGMAELIAIIVCGLIIVAFLLACIVMVRNSKRKKKQDQTSIQKKRPSERSHRRVN